MNGIGVQFKLEVFFLLEEILWINVKDIKVSKRKIYVN